MGTKHHDVPWLEVAFFENRQKFPPDELAKYAGQHIAWSWDGTRIVDSDPNPEELCRKLEAAGIPTNRVVFGYVDPPDQVNL